MGLAQRRIIANFQQTQFPAWKAEFLKIVGFEIPMEFDWESMARDTHEDPEAYQKYWDLVYFQTLSGIFKNLCVDDMGREAVKGSIKKITVSGKEGSSASASTFEGGVLNYKHQPFTNVDGVEERVTKITKMIEAKL